MWFKRRTDFSWIDDYIVEDYVCDRVDIREYDGIYGEWKTKDGKHVLGIFLNGPFYLIYFFDGAICDKEYNDCRLPKYVSVFENVLKRAYAEIHANKSKVEKKYGKNVPVK